MPVSEEFKAQAGTTQRVRSTGRMTTQDTPPHTMGSDAESLVEGFVKSLNAYQRELRLYPPDHPRLLKRVQSLLSDLESFLAAEGDLLLDVHDATLCVNGSASPESSHTKQMLSCLRLRMIRAVRIAPGVTEDEVRFLANLLAQEPDLTRVHGESTQAGAHLEVFYFERKADGDGEGGEDSTVDFEVDEEWDGFSVSEIEVISKVLQNAKVRRTIEELTPGLCDDEGLSFAASFFGVLKEDPQADWQDLSKLRDMVLAGLDLLWRSSESQQSISAIPTQLLSPSEGIGDQLSTHLRWVLLQKFFPNSDASSKEADEFAEQTVDTQPDRFVACSSVELTEELTLEQKRFREHFGTMNLLTEYTDVVGEMTRQELSLTERELQRRSLDTLHSQLARSRMSAAMLTQLLETAEQLPERLRMAWLVETIQCAAQPSELLQCVSHSDRQAYVELLNNPPDLAESVKSDEMIEGLTQDQTRAEVLRRILSHRDRFALDALLGLFEGADSERAISAGWLETCRQVCHRASVLDSWLESRNSRLVHAGATYVLLCLPTEALANWVSTMAERAPHLLKNMLRQLPKRDKPDATAVIDECLREGGPSVRVSAIEALGTQADTWSFTLLQDLLKAANSFRCNEAEVSATCKSLAKRESEGGLEILEQIKIEKRLFLPAWHRTIRAAAAKVLGDDCEEGTSS